MSGEPKYKKIQVRLPKRILALYTGQKVRSAILESTGNMTLYKAVRFGQIMDAVYEQGLKDGRREIIEQFDGTIHKQLDVTPTQHSARLTLLME